MTTQPSPKPVRNSTKQPTTCCVEPAGAADTALQWILSSTSTM